MTGTAADCNLAVVLYDLYDSGGSTPQIITAGDNNGTSGTITATTSGNVPSSGCFAIAASICSQGTTAATTTWTTPASWSLGADQMASARTRWRPTTIPARRPAARSPPFTHSRMSTDQTAAIIVAQPPVAGGVAVQAVSTGGAYQGITLTVAVVTGAARLDAGTRHRARRSRSP